MTIRLNPYLSFRDDARQAMEFYRSVFGGELTMSTFGEAGMSDDPAEKDKIMHAMLDTGSGLVLMGADTPAGMELAPSSRVSVSLSGDDEATLRRWFEALAEGGQVDVPLAGQVWGDVFGQVTDRFGMRWLVNIGAGPA